MVRTAPVVNYTLSAKVVRIIDGDTIRVEMDLGFTIKIVKDIRLLGCDTPEMRGPESCAGKYVTERVLDWFGDTEEIIVESVDYTVGKFGRCLCNVYVNGECLNQWLLLERLAWPTDDAGRVPGGREMKQLDLPEGVRQKVKEAMA